MDDGGASFDLQVSSVNRTSMSRSPAAPFITSSMVQDAANRLGYKVANTMSTAQALFEGGDQGKKRDLQSFCKVCVALLGLRQRVPVPRSSRNDIQARHSIPPQQPQECLHCVGLPVQLLRHKNVSKVQDHRIVACI